MECCESKLYWSGLLLQSVSVDLSGFSLDFTWRQRVVHSTYQFQLVATLDASLVVATSPLQVV